MRFWGNEMGKSVISGRSAPSCFRYASAYSKPIGEVFADCGNARFQNLGFLGGGDKPKRERERERVQLVP